MTVYDLNRDQLTELKQRYLQEKLDEQGEEISYEELAFVDNYVSDNEIFAAYDHVDFVPDDFSCSVGEEEKERFSLEISGTGTRFELASDLREIANKIENDGYFGGLASYGTDWGLDKE